MANGPEGLEIRTQNGADVYQLSGRDRRGASRRPGAGEGEEEEARQSGDVPMFVVSGLAKDYGACAAGHP